MGYAYAVNQQLVSSLPPEVTEGIFTFAPSPAEGSPAFAAVQRIAGTQTPDPYTCQVYDHINLVLLAIAAAGDASGQAIRDNIRRIAQGGGTAVDNAVDGLRAIAAGQKVDYDGASGPCDFTETGDIQDCKFRYDQVRGGRITLLRIA